MRKIGDRFTLQSCVSEDEFELIKYCANKEHMNVSTLTRKAVLEHCLKVHNLDVKRYLKQIKNPQPEQPRSEWEKQFKIQEAEIAKLKQENQSLWSKLQGVR
jgi:hypothetical protein